MSRWHSTPGGRATGVPAERTTEHDRTPFPHLRTPADRGHGKTSGTKVRTMAYWRKPYQRKDGTRVRGHWVTQNPRQRSGSSLGPVLMLVAVVILLLAVVG